MQLMEVLETYLADVNFRHNHHTAVIDVVDSPGFFHVRRTNIINNEVNQFSHNLISCPKGNGPNQEADAYNDAFEFFETIKRRGFSEDLAYSLKDEYFRRKREGPVKLQKAG